MTTKVQHAEVLFRRRVASPRPPIVRVDALPPEQGAAGDSVASTLHLARPMRALEVSHA